MSAATPNQDFFSDNEPSSCRIETQGGTVYWLSRPDDASCRWIVREQLHSSDTHTMIMHRLPGADSPPDLGDNKFRGRLSGDVQRGMPFVIEIDEEETRIVSEVVVGIEVGEVPEMIFR
jgi:hypothetical protein